ARGRGGFGVCAENRPGGSGSDTGIVASASRTGSRQQDRCRSSRDPMFSQSRTIAYDPKSDVCRARGPELLRIGRGSAIALRRPRRYSGLEADGEAAGEGAGVAGGVVDVGDAGGGLAAEA